LKVVAVSKWESSQKNPKKTEKLITQICVIGFLEICTHISLNFLVLSHWNFLHIKHWKKVFAFQAIKKKNKKKIGTYSCYKMTKKPAEGYFLTNNSVNVHAYFSEDFAAVKLKFLCTFKHWNKVFAFHSIKGK